MRRWKKVLLKAAAVVAALALAVLFYVTCVVMQPQEQLSVADPDQPLLSRQDTVVLSELSELQQLVRDFPTAVLLSAGSGSLTLEAGASYSEPYEDGWGRITSLTYRTAEGFTLQVDSIYPARALSLMDGENYRLSGVTGHSIAGMQSVRMENGTSIRLHMQSSSGLYVVTLPKELDGSIAATVQSLQLMELD